MAGTSDDEAQVPYVETSSQKKASKTGNREFQISIEKHRFCIAFTIIVGVMALLALLIIIHSADLITLAGTFSGWVAAVIGFYFLQQTADRAQQQATQVYERAEGKTLKGISIGQEQIEELRETFYKELDSLQNDIDERDEIIEDLLDELEMYKAPEEDEGDDEK